MYVNFECFLLYNWPFTYTITYAYIYDIYLHCGLWIISVKILIAYKKVICILQNVVISYVLWNYRMLYLKEVLRNVCKNAINA